MRRYHTPEHRAKIEEALSKHLDPHRHVAAWKAGVAAGEVTKAQRQEAKQANYVYLYSTRG